MIKKKVDGFDFLRYYVCTLRHLGFGNPIRLSKTHKKRKYIIIIMKKLLSLMAVLAIALNVSALDFSISGTGATQTQGSTSSAFGTALRLEKFVVPSVSVGYVQGINVATPDVRGSSELFAAYNLNYSIAKFKNQAFVGGSASLGYGNGVPTWYAGPLVGNRFFVKDNVYILTQANYDVGLNGVADNIVRYTLGLGVRF